ncbi:site-specific integrase [Streptomyces sp. SID4917]|nr:site-specific integrase [Streptomyces sp. SID4917]
MEAMSQSALGVPMADRNWRLAEYLEHWLEDIVRVNRRPATYAQCERISRLYLKPALGKFDMTKLSVPVVQDFLNRSLAEGHSVPNVQVIRKVLSAALTSAQREELVNRNVARLTVLPTYEHEEVKPWSPTEAKRFLEASRANAFYPAFLLLVLYGLRRGEVLGLRWCDIDFDNNVLHVRHQLGRVGRELQLGPVKTKAGRRPLPLVSFIADELMNHQAVQEARNVSIAPEGLVFPAADGSPLEASVLVRTFKRICRENGLRVVRVHDLRHGFATTLKDLGTPVRDAQLLLGHARVTTTQEIYQHDNMAQRQSALERVVTELVGQPKSDTVWYRLGASRSRQIGRQAADFVSVVTSSISGAGRGTLTPGLILGKSSNDALAQRLTSVDQVTQACRRTWKLGCVAVKMAVNDSVLELAA